MITARKLLKIIEASSELLLDINDLSKKISTLEKQKSDLENRSEKTGKPVSTVEISKRISDLKNQRSHLEDQLESRG